MKIAFFIHDIFKTGGTERVTTTLANGLCSKNHDVIIISEYSGEEVKFKVDDEIDIIELNAQEYSNSIYRKVMMYKKLRKVIKGNKIDILICVDVSLYLYAFLMRSNTKVIAWEHFNFYCNLGDKRRTFARKFAAKYADALVVLSKNDLDSYKKELSEIKKIKYIYNPLPFDIERRSLLNNKEILAIGRYTSQKGFDLLLQSWNKIANSLPQWKLRIVGDGEERNNLEDIIEKENINNVELVSFTQDILSEYKKADIFVLSSRFEGFGMVILEAQASGIPVISFECPYGPSELIDNNENGILVENLNTNLLAESIYDLANDRKKMEMLSSKALKSVEKFRLSKIVEEWERLFDEL